MFNLLTKPLLCSAPATGALCLCSSRAGAGAINWSLQPDCSQLRADHSLMFGRSESDQTQSHCCRPKYIEGGGESSSAKHHPAICYNQCGPHWHRPAHWPSTSQSVLCTQHQGRGGYRHWGLLFPCGLQYPNNSNCVWLMMTNNKVGQTINMYLLLHCMYCDSVE